MARLMKHPSHPELMQDRKTRHWQILATRRGLLYTIPLETSVVTVAELRLAAFDLDPVAFCRAHSCVVGSMSVGEAVELYRGSLQAGQRSVQYVTDVERSLKIFVRFCPDTVAEITPSHLESFLEGMAEGINKSTMHKHFRRAAQLLKFCEKRGWLQANPIRKVAGPRVPRKKKASRFVMTAADMTTIKPYCSDQLWAALVSMWSCGLRMMDVLQLDVGSIDEASGLLEVWKSKDGSRRSVPIPDETTLHALVKVATHRPRLSKDVISSGLKNAVRESGLKKSVTPHKLRDSAITRWVDDHDLGTACAWAGHASEITTMLYVHPSKNVEVQPTGLI